MNHIERRRDGFLVTTDPVRLDIHFIDGYLVRSYWAEGIPRETVECSIANSLCFGVYDGDKQVGFARVITDSATFAYLADVFIIESHRGRGLSRFLMECIMTHPRLQNFRRFTPATLDAHGLYAQFGFKNSSNSDRFTEIFRPEVYKKAGE
jgi:GNAT superfamily N-acetyltransferase